MQDELANLRPRSPSGGDSPSITQHSTTPRMIPMIAMTPPFNSLPSQPPMLNRSTTMPLHERHDSIPGKSIFHPISIDNPHITFNAITTPQHDSKTSSPQPPKGDMQPYFVQLANNTKIYSSGKLPAHSSVHGSLPALPHIQVSTQPRNIDTQSETEDQRTKKTGNTTQQQYMTHSDHTGGPYMNFGEIVSGPIENYNINLSGPFAREPSSPDSNTHQTPRVKHIPGIALHPAPEDMSDNAIRPAGPPSLHGPYVFKEDRVGSRKQSAGDAIAAATATLSAFQSMNQARQSHLLYLSGQNPGGGLKGREIAELRKAIDYRTIELDNQRIVNYEAYLGQQKPQ
jgi:hypothetical protein